MGRASGTKWRTFWCIWAGFEENARPVEMEPSTRTSTAVVLDTTFLNLATWHFVGAASPRMIDCVCGYKAHLAKVPAAPPTPSTPVIRRRSSSTSSLDGIRWSETDSERVAKKSRRIGNGEEVIPLSLHQKKMDEQAHAFRNEMGTYLNASNRAFVEQEECDVVEAIFLRELSVEQRGRLFQYLVG